MTSPAEDTGGGRQIEIRKRFRRIAISHLFRFHCAGSGVYTVHFLQPVQLQTPEPSRLWPPALNRSGIQTHNLSDDEDEADVDDFESLHCVFPRLISTSWKLEMPLEMVLDLVFVHN